MLFWTAAGVGSVVLVLTLRFVPSSAIRAGGRFDLRTTARRQVLLTNIASAVFGFAMFAMSLVLPQVLLLPTSTGYGLGETMFTVGLVMAPSGLVMMAMAPLSARVSRTKGPKATLMIGAGIVAAGYGLSVVLMSAIWHLVLVSSLIGAGIGFAYGAMPALIMGAVPGSETAATLPSHDGFELIMAIACGTALVALAVAAFLPARQTPSFETPSRRPVHAAA